MIIPNSVYFTSIRRNIGLIQSQSKCSDYNGWVETSSEDISKEVIPDTYTGESRWLLRSRHEGEIFHKLLKDWKRDFVYASIGENRSIGQQQYHEDL